MERGTSVAVPEPDFRNPSAVNSAPFDWNALPILPAGWTLLRPHKALKGLAFFALLPVVLAALFSIIPRAGRSTLGTTSLIVWLLALAGGLAFMATLLVYRIVRKRQQMRLNASLGDLPPERFVLYLRSFRRTGATVVPSHFPTLAERRLLGNFLDVELALTLAVGDRLPVVAVGHTQSSLGAAKLFTDDAGWKDLVEKLAGIAVAIFVVPDDREGTLWEINRLLGDPELRMKTVVLMPPEQHGWWCWLQRLPTMAQSWELARERLSHLELPSYQPEGAFLLPDNRGEGYLRSAFQHFASEHVRDVVAAAANGARPPLPAELVRAPDEDWRAFIDPVWPTTTMCVLIGLWVFGDSTSSGRFDAVLVAVVFGSAASLLVASIAFTRTRDRADTAREPLHASTWFGQRRSPRVVRVAFNLLVSLTVVAGLRFFVAEPFRVPSGSMLPTVMVGDFILVSKSSYGLRMPISNRRLAGSAIPNRGEVIVFHYPMDPRTQFLKRVVGIPGDEVAYTNDKLTINGQLVPVKSSNDFYDEDSLHYSRRFSETIGKIQYSILVDPDREVNYGPESKSFPMSESCLYTIEGVMCKVPEGHYFVMGDNRDNSLDSRYWGFVPDDLLVGKAFLVWMNFGAIHRIGVKF